ncbi:hypothetical protein PpBr36_08598 [Pyricularia pennisetigena]|uniref:hypothetical protein n=1 Tax=Pyricularia pennisetigena TaxID=1578925 RepID=UPI0011538CCD|nr:hypothetical protein PpBr36_08598 [Pyricularia pennisetigena]TLS24618.1 hypothetical protein PpBr36_08598 [Pyricularia pennisetigena]
MSTFDGIIREFPDIRVDFFRNNGTRPPLACFLSHVHSDHLAGLELLRSPFVYCSAATRELLLRLERYPCRINYAKGILEARVQTYKHLKNLLKPIPLDTLTQIELGPGRSIGVTLLDANHCTGAVMFLFEGDGKAVLYTGDIRSEPWHVNSIARSPCMMEYSAGIKTLSCIYLDTSNTEDVAFPSKDAGLKELLEKVIRYPKDTIFHFQAWTFGYEQVWIALSKALNSPVHVDDYKLQLYRSLVAKGNPKDPYATQFHMGPEVAALVGFMCGNTAHPGCLARDVNVRLHSCERGNYCKTVRDAEAAGTIVHIEPIITRLVGGEEVAEMGIGGGGDDLEREAELDSFALQDMGGLLQIISENQAIEDSVKIKIGDLLMNAISTRRNVSLDMAINLFDDSNEADLNKAVDNLARKNIRLAYGPSKTSPDNYANVAAVEDGTANNLPRRVRFPYSRHSSYPELCHLVDRFRPMDVWPCTYKAKEWIQHGLSIKSLFGKYCSGDVFEHDKIQARFAPRSKASEIEHNDDSQFSAITQRSDDTGYQLSQTIEHGRQLPSGSKDSRHDKGPGPGHTSEVISPTSDAPDATSHQHKRGFAAFAESDMDNLDGRDREIIEDEDTDDHPEDVFLHDSQSSEVSESAMATRRTAFNTVLGATTFIRGQVEYHGIPLLSTTDAHSRSEIELGNPSLWSAPLGSFEPAESGLSRGGDMHNR